MVLFNVESVKILWDTWSVRGLIILSLVLQSFLILFAPFRKQMGGNSVFMSSLWVAYLLADWVATFTIGLIFRAESNDIKALWAPFLLLHLGGPDTITSFSLEDNEFWIRHLLQLMIQLCASVIVILQSIRHNKLLLPTLLVFIVGVIKYAERNIALYRASFDHYGDKNPNVSFLEKTAATESESESHYLGIMLRRELGPHGTLKNLLVGPLLSPFRRNFTRRAFLKRQSRDVLNIMEIELSLLYEALYTKLPVVHCKIGYVFRIISLGCTFGALMSFMLITKHYKLGKFDVWLTNSLLISAIALEFISIGLLFFSDFNLLDHYYWQGNREIKFLCWKVEFDHMSTGVKNRRWWSKKIYLYNFLTNHFSDCPSWLNKLANFLSIRISNLKVRTLEDQEWRFIFDELIRKAQEAETVEAGKRLCLQRGDGILDDDGNLIWSIKELDYTESLLTWHIATEICFRVDQNTASDNTKYKAISKLLSDYMLYLLAMQPALMASVSIGSKGECKRAYDEMCRLAYNDLNAFFVGRDLNVQSLAEAMFNDEAPTSYVLQVCGYERTSLIRGARMLAHQLMDQNSGFSWELMSKVWVELMCYAAINCRPNVHAQQTSKGGQLLTFVWLLMNHLGLGTQFSTEQLSQTGGTELGQDQP
ncbi:hypothetical protein SLEP1_g47923 [Rubroshorea leprosula]|uniref:DUF4220 domain-containing protein n=1 Tax=Rubroshorea leprosula TaxID=152421 RepID=A0AAV5LUC0_9ROSI|nr:hypothetical protein SLEP1_g47923 [Rubroshorea leprosula]